MITLLLLISAAVLVAAMVNGIRLIDVSTNIAQNSLLPIGTDRFGQKQIVIGILDTVGANRELIELTAEQWGNRIVQIPAFSDPTSSGGGFWVPPIFPELMPNTTLTARARHNGVAAEVVGARIMTMIADSNGRFPASMQRHIGELHTQFAEGVATNGAFGNTATQDILNEVPDDKWMPLMGAALGDTPSVVRFSHPFDEGFPPFIAGMGSVGQGLSTFQALPPTNPLHGADTLTYQAQDDSGSAIDMYLWNGRIAGGRTVLSNRTPYSL